MSTGDAGSLIDTLDRVSRDVRGILGRALDGLEVSVAEADVLAETTGRDLHAPTLTADELRRRHVGDTVTYVVNRNINFTNVCIKHCGFCAFSRDHREEEGYFLPIEEVVRRAREAWDLGATEATGFVFRERLAVYPAFATRAEFVDETLRARVAALIDADGLVREPHEYWRRW